MRPLLHGVGKIGARLHGVLEDGNASGGAGMTSDSDDLEQQLRENLKLRAELGAKVAKAKQGGGMAYRLGWVLYWISLMLALASGVFVLGSMAGAGILSLIAAWMSALALYGIGRAFRYVLAAD